MPDAARLRRDGEDLRTFRSSMRLPRHRVTTSSEWTDRFANVFAEN